MKKLTAALIALVMALSVMSTSAFAASYETDVKYGVNFRTGPSTNSTVIRMIRTGENIHVIEKVNAYWLKVQTKDGKVGYISADSKYTNYGANGSATVETTGYPWLRSAASTNSTIYRSVPKGTRLTVLAQPNQHWVKVNYNGQVGYISTGYVNFVSGSGSSGSGKPGNSGGSNQPSSSKADAVINTAKSLIGRATYDFGTRNPGKLIFDCSSFTQYVFGKHGVDLKWGTRYQKDAGSFVSKSNLKKGDLVFFTVGNSSSIGHVGIYIGGGDFIHILDRASGTDVHISNLNSGYWSNHYVTARRVL